MNRPGAEAVLMWFRRDLRLGDNPALRAAVATGLAVIPLFLWTPEEESPAPGAASRWWLHGSLMQLDRTLRARGSRLIIRRGPAAESLLSVADEAGAHRIFCSRVEEPASLALEATLRAKLEARGIALEAYDAGVLFERGSIRTAGGSGFRVFTPFWNAVWSARGGLRRPARAPASIAAPRRWPRSLRIAELELEPKIDWAAGIRAVWEPGETSAQARLRSFRRHRVRQYGVERDRTDRDGTSRLSPHLHFGEVSPIQVWHAVSGHAGAESYLRQLAWREFAIHVLCEHPRTVSEPFHPEFRDFPWRGNARRLRAWQRGKTGYPLVDASMRELWATGWMPNRARMVAGSFLVKHLLIPWQQGAAWFLDTLVDADVANNTLGWQWVAGCGVDAAPYFRIFNPVLQGEKFDPSGDYVRRWLSELRGLPPRWIHRPWAAPREILASAGVRLGASYPRPIVDAAAARAAALSAFAAMKAKGIRSD